MSLLQTTPANSVEDVRRFFEAFAHQNVEQHGKAKKLLHYRIALLKKYAQFKYSDEVLDIGCGNGHHLFALDGFIGSGIGVDIAAGMVDTAQHNSPPNAMSTYRFLVDDAHKLSSIPDESVDVVFCVGALEHMVDKRSVLTNVRRVLRKGGRFVCLTLNDAFLWYRNLAPLLGYATQHLATDRRIDTEDADRLMRETGFKSSSVAYWTFIPRGDMPAMFAWLCRIVDWSGRFCFSSFLRSGLVLRGVK